MASPLRNLVILAGVIAAFIVLSGCTAINAGYTGYSGDNFTISLENAGAPSEAYVQVTAYQLSGLSQEEYLVVSRPVSLVTGPNRIEIPAKLPAGNYKLYTYVIQNGERKTAVIRDIGV